MLAPQIKVRVDYAAAAQYGVPAPPGAGGAAGPGRGREGHADRRGRPALCAGGAPARIGGRSRAWADPDRDAQRPHPTVEDRNDRGRRRPNQISRDDGKRRIVLSANASGRALSEIVADIRKVGGRDQAARGLLHHPRRPVPGAGGGLAPGRPAVHRVADADVRGAVQPLQVGGIVGADHGEHPAGPGRRGDRPVAVGPAAERGGLVGFITLAGISVRNGILEGQPLHQPDALRGRGLRPEDDPARLAGAARPC